MVYCHGTISEKELRKELVVLVFEAGSRKQLAQQRRVAKAAVDSFLSGSRPPSKFLLEALGYVRVVMYCKVEETSGQALR
jgi:hypothetical protein